MITEALLVPFVLWCGYMPEDPVAYQERPDLCGRIYETRTACLAQEARIESKFMPECAQLKANETLTLTSRKGSHHRHPDNIGEPDLRPESPPGHGTAPSRASLPSISCSSTARICADQDHIPAKEQERIPATAGITIVSPDLLAKPPPVWTASLRQPLNAETGVRYQGDPTRSERPGGSGWQPWRSPSRRCEG